MTDEQIDALEVAAKKMIETSCGPFASFFNEDFSEVILELIAALRQQRAERDWLAVNLANGLVDPGFIEHLAELGGMSPPDPATLIEAAKEAVK